MRRHRHTLVLAGVAFLAAAALVVRDAQPAGALITWENVPGWAIPAADAFVDGCDGSTQWLSEQLAGKMTFTGTVGFVAPPAVPLGGGGAATLTATAVGTGATTTGTVVTGTTAAAGFMIAAAGLCTGYQVGKWAFGGSIPVAPPSSPHLLVTNGIEPCGGLVSYAQAFDRCVTVDPGETGWLSNTVLRFTVGTNPATGSRVADLRVRQADGSTGWYFDPPDTGAAVVPLVCGGRPDCYVSQMPTAAHVGVVAELVPGVAIYSEGLLDSAVANLGPLQRMRGHIICENATNNEQTTTVTSPTFRAAEIDWPMPKCAPGFAPVEIVIKRQVEIVTGNGATLPEVAWQDQETTVDWRVQRTSIGTHTWRDSIRECLIRGPGCDAPQAAPEAQTEVIEIADAFPWPEEEPGPSTSVSTTTTTPAPTTTVVGDPAPPSGICPPGSSDADCVVDPNGDGAECFPSGWALFNPFEWVYKPVRCVLIWAFVPKQSLNDRLDQLHQQAQGHAPFSVIAWAHTATTQLTEGYTEDEGCGFFPDFSPTADGTGRLPCQPEGGTALALAYGLVSAAIVLGTVWLMWSMSLKALSGGGGGDE